MMTVLVEMWLIGAFGRFSNLEPIERFGWRGGIFYESLSYWDATLLLLESAEGRLIP